MARYIDADLIKNIELIPYKRKSGNINVIIANMAIAGAKQVVDKIPTADVAPVVHAHWRYMHRSKSFCLFVGVCSNCESPNIVADYCGNCGAKMDEEVEDAKIYKHR